MVLEFAVTGGAGFIGSHLARALLEKGSVTIIDDFTTGKRGNLPEGARFVEASMLDDEALDVIRSADCVFHLGGMVGVPMSVREPQRCADVNVKGTVNVLEACRKADCRVVFASSASVYGDNPKTPYRETDLPAPVSPYAVSKLAGEGLLAFYAKEYGLKCVSLRLFNVYGPGQKISSGYAAVVPAFINAARASDDLRVNGDGSQTRDFIYVDDVVQAFLLSAEKGSGAYNIGSGKPTSVKHLAGKIIELTQTKSRITRAPKRAGDVRDSLADVSKARRELGFEPAYSLADGLSRVIGNG